MVADNDAGGLTVYSQAGQENGLALIWLLLVLAPVLFVVQEMVARLGAVTGAGHARLIVERFGRRWGYFALGDLIVLNLLTIITEFIGVALALEYFGVNRYLSVPFAGLALILVTGIGSFRRWELTMFSLVGISLVAIPLVVLSGLQHPAVQVPIRSMASSPFNAGLVLLVVAMVGTTVAPWQLFFQQSNVVDKRITARWLGYERVDLAIGTVLFATGAIAVFAATAIALGGSSGHAAFADAGHVAAGFRDRVGWWAGALFAVALLNGSLLGASAVTLSTSYAIGDVYGVKHSLHRRWRDAPIFHGSFALCMLVAATVVLIPNAPLGVVTVGVQVLAGVLLPSATVFLLLLCNDRAVLGPRTNPWWLNVIGVFVVGVLIEMSALLTLSSLFPTLHLDIPAVGLTTAWAVVLVGFGLSHTYGNRRVPAPNERTEWERLTWTTPRLESLPPPTPSHARTIGLVILRAYVLVAAVLVAARIALAIIGG